LEFLSWRIEARERGETGEGETEREEARASGELALAEFLA
jgi:hypothetical protein